MRSGIRIPRDVDQRPISLPDPRCRSIAGDADNFMNGSSRCAECLAEGTVARPEFAAERLRDNHGTTALSTWRISLLYRASLHDWNPQRGEESRRDRVPCRLPHRLVSWLNVYHCRIVPAKRKTSCVGDRLHARHRCDAFCEFAVMSGPGLPDGDLATHLLLCRERLPGFKAEVGGGHSLMRAHEEACAYQQNEADGDLRPNQQSAQPAATSGAAEQALAAFERV